MDTESNQSSDNGDRNCSLEDDRQRTGLFARDEPDNLMPPWSVPPGLLVPAPRQPEPGAGHSASAAPRPAASAAGDAVADDGAWPGVAPPAGWFLHARRPPPAASPGSGPAVPGTADGPDAELERIASEPLAPGLPEPEFPEPELPEPNSPSRIGPHRNPTRPLRLPPARPRPRPRLRLRPRIRRLALAERRHRRGALPAPRTGRLLVLAPDAEAGPPGPGPDPGPARPPRRPGISARPFRLAGCFPVAAVPRGLDRGRHPVGAGSPRCAGPAALSPPASSPSAPGPAAAPGPAPAPGPAATPCPRPPHQARTPGQREAGSLRPGIRRQLARTPARPARRAGVLRSRPGRR